MIKYIVFTGPESTGKSTLATHFSKKFNIPLVQEYAREYLTILQNKYKLEDLFHIAEQQKKQEGLSNNELIICDTDLLTLYIWMEEVFGICQLDWADTLTSYGENRIYFLCKADIPWEADILRENPYDRERLYELYKERMKLFGLNFVEVMGEGENRVNLVDQTVSKHLLNKLSNKMENIIYHITSEEWYNKWEEKDYYESETLFEERFIHLSNEGQVEGVLDRYFTGMSKLVKLHVDTNLLIEKLVYEEATNGELFPHLYGPLNKSAIVKIEKLK